MHWIWLALAIVFEVGWATAMKASAGFTKPVPSVITVASYVLSLAFLTLATRRIELGVAYAIWAGSGAAIIAAVGVVHFKEPMGALKLASLGLIVAGIVGLKLATPATPAP